VSGALWVRFIYHHSNFSTVATEFFYQILTQISIPAPSLLTSTIYENLINNRVATVLQWELRIVHVPYSASPTHSFWSHPGWAQYLNSSDCSIALLLGIRFLLCSAIVLLIVIAVRFFATAVAIFLLLTTTIFCTLFNGCLGFQNWRWRLLNNVWKLNIFYLTFAPNNRGSPGDGGNLRAE